MEALFSILTAFGLSASTGLNAYLPLLIVALLAKFTNLLTLQAPWNTLESWWIIGLLMVLSTIEFFADKIPEVNHVNDAIQTFIRPAAGAIAFASSTQVVTDMSPVLSLALGLLISGGVHATKSLAVRPAVTATTAGVGNIPVSIVEDVFATFVSIISIAAPILMAAILVLTVVLLVWWLNQRHVRTKKVPFKAPGSDLKR